MKREKRRGGFSLVRKAMNNAPAAHWERGRAKGRPYGRAVIDMADWRAIIDHAYGLER